MGTKTMARPEGFERALPTMVIEGVVEPLVALGAEANSRDAQKADRTTALGRLDRLGQQDGRPASGSLRQNRGFITVSSEPGHGATFEGYLPRHIGRATVVVGSGEAASVVMPGVDGLDLANRLVALQPGNKCLLMSGHPGDVFADRGMLDAGVSVIQKPFTERELATKVRHALGHDEVSPDPATS